MAKWSDEETDNPLLADHQNFYKVELWTKDEQRIERMLFADSDLDKARAIFVAIRAGGTNPLLIDVRIAI